MVILIYGLFALSAGLLLFTLIRWVVTGRAPIRHTPSDATTSLLAACSTLRRYNCKRCGASVSTTDPLGGYCSGCFDDVFSASSERMDREG